MSFPRAFSCCAARRSALETLFGRVDGLDMELLSRVALCLSKKALLEEFVLLEGLALVRRAGLMLEVLRRRLLLLPFRREALTLELLRRSPLSLRSGN